MRRLGENLRLRLLSVFIAVLLWIYVINIQNPELKTDFEDVSVQIVNIDELASYGLTLAEHGALTTTVKIKGKSDALKKLSKDDIKAVIDLRECNTQGSVSLPIRFSVSGVQGLEIEGVPSKIDLQIEKYIQAQKTIEVVMQGSDNKNAVYELKSIKPNTVTIGGPESLINSIGSVKVFVDVANQKKDIVIVKKYKIFNKNGIDITESSILVKDTQNIQVDIDYFSAKEVPIVPKLSGVPAQGSYISQVAVQPDKIIIFGQDKMLEKISEVKTKEISISNADSSFSKETGLTIPTAVRTKFTEDVKVDVSIEKEQKKTVTISKSDIKIINSSESNYYEILEPEVNINIIGRRNVIEALKISDLSPFIDVKDLEPGEHNMKVRIDSKDEVRIDGSNSIIKIKIAKNETKIPD